MKEFLNKAEASFKAAMRGEEAVQRIIWGWGAVGYLVAYFIADKLIKMVHIRAIDVIISLLMVSYFSWHFYVLKKCAPKKPQLTEKEKKELHEANRKEMGKKIMRKLLLQEPVGNSDPVFVTLVIDVFCIAVFLGYIAR